jgi:hypothetical protein
MASKRLILSIVLSIISFSSCSYLNYSLMSQDGRKNELRAISAKVVKAVTWAEFSEVAKFMDDQIVDKSSRQLIDQYKSIKIKDVKETNLDFDDENKSAYQVLEIEGFSSPSNIVKSEFTQFKWIFRAGQGGWQITDVNFSNSPKTLETE